MRKSMAFEGMGKNVNSELNDERSILDADGVTGLDHVQALLDRDGMI